MKNRERKNCHKLKYANAEEKKKIITRLSVIEGQIRGISSMIKENRYCSDILIQISSAENALRSLSNNILEHHMRTCITDEIQKGKDHQYPRENQKGNGCSHRRDRHKGGEKGSDDASDGVEGP